MDDWDDAEKSGNDDVYGVDRLKMAVAACILIGLFMLHLYRRGRS